MSFLSQNQTCVITFLSIGAFVCVFFFFKLFMHWSLKAAAIMVGSANQSTQRIFLEYSELRNIYERTLFILWGWCVLHKRCLLVSINNRIFVGAQASPFFPPSEMAEWGNSGLQMPTCATKKPQAHLQVNIRSLLYLNIHGIILGTWHAGRHQREGWLQ